MSSNLDIPVLKRPAFFDGLRLTAADLADVQAFHRELRWLHNRSLHNWGIAFGYAVSGARGERTVQVQPGCALDCLGRDLLLSEPLEMTIPAVAGAADGSPETYYLTASYAEDTDLPLEKRAGTCGTSGTVRRPETPTIGWYTPNEYRRGLDVILATIEVQNCQLAADVSGAERRDAIPPQQPYIATGQTKTGEVKWRLWPEDDPVGVATTVPTTRAGFRTTPRYQAHIVGEQIFSGQVDENGEQRQLVVDGYAQVALSTAFSFELRLIFPVGVVPGKSEIDTVTEQDLTWVIASIGQRIGVHIPAQEREPILHMNGLHLSVGQELKAMPVSPCVVEPEDFDALINKITQRNNISVDALMGPNCLTRDTMSLTAGQSLIISSDPLPLNPPDLVFNEDFVAKLNTGPDCWNVAWMGVEG